ncbi:MAG: metal-sulfur cluster assembly factor [Puniceicoccales bacterium]|jgi:metal-sulfur cluster biosynthetic enzyme|nr:metal-sulfur cluster assembly factor [Puniceicoccales bacterium]
MTDSEGSIACATEYFWDILKGVYDPEIGVNIVDLGMVYAVDLKSADGEKFDVTIEMTLTSPWCPLADTIADEVKAAIGNTGKCSNVAVSFVFDPPWHIDMITTEGKMQLGIF